MKGKRGAISEFIMYEHPFMVVIALIPIASLIVFFSQNKEIVLPPNTCKFETGFKCADIGYSMTNEKEFIHLVIKNDFGYDITDINISPVNGDMVENECYYKGKPESMGFFRDNNKTFVFECKSKIPGNTTISDLAATYRRQKQYDEEYLLHKVNGFISLKDLSIFRNYYVKKNQELG